MSNLIARWYADGRWTAAQVTAAADRGWITSEQAAHIVSGDVDG